MCLNRGRLANKLFKKKINSETTKRKNLDRLLPIKDGKIHCHKQTYPIDELCKNVCTKNCDENEEQLSPIPCFIEEISTIIDL